MTSPQVLRQTLSLTLTLAAVLLASACDAEPACLPADTGESFSTVPMKVR